MKVLILKGKDRHTIRLISGLKAVGINPLIVTEYNSIPNEYFDIAFIDPSLDFDPSSKIKADILGFYDSEDSTLDFIPGVGYETLKDKVTFYAKMNYEENDPRDNIKNIAFPLEAQCVYSRYALNLPKTTTNPVPFFLGTNTFIGNYKTVPQGYYSSTDNLTSLGKYKDEIVYSQRVDWLLAMQQAGIPFNGGIVYGAANLARSPQVEYFGEGLDNFIVNPMDKSTFIHALINNGISLCPTGHERISWRVYDIMLAGSVMLFTDTKSKKMLVMPDEYITIPDGVNAANIIQDVIDNYNELRKASIQNRIKMAMLSPDNLWQLFLSQLQ